MRGTDRVRTSSISQLKSHRVAAETRWFNGSAATEQVERLQRCASAVQTKCGGSTITGWSGAGTKAGCSCGSPTRPETCRSRAAYRSTTAAAADPKQQQVETQRAAARSGC